VLKADSKAPLHSRVFHPWLVRGTVRFMRDLSSPPHKNQTSFFLHMLAPFFHMTPRQVHDIEAAWPPVSHTSGIEVASFQFTDLTPPGSHSKRFFISGLPKDSSAPSSIVLSSVPSPIRPQKGDNFPSKLVRERVPPFPRDVCPSPRQ